MMFNVEVVLFAQVCAHHHPLVNLFHPPRVLESVMVIVVVAMACDLRQPKYV